MFANSSRAKISALSALFCVLLNYDVSFGASKHQNVYEYYEFGDIRDESLNSQLELAQKGNVDAMVRLAEAYRSGLLSGGFDFKNAQIWYRRAAELGNAQAQLQLSHILRRGQGGEQRYKEGVYWLEKSAELGFFEAQYYFGQQFVLDDESSLEEYKIGLLWLLKAARQDGGFLGRRGISIFTREELPNLPPNYKTEICSFIQKEHRKFPNSPADKIGLGNCALLGMIQLADYGVSIEELFIEAAELGQIFFAPPEDFPPAGTRAIKKKLLELEENALRGDKHSLMVITDCFTFGTYPDSHANCRDDQRAFYWLTKASEEIGNSFFPMELARLYTEGIGTGRDRKRAAEILEELASKGDPAAMIRLSSLITSGKFRDKSLEEAFYWTRSAYEIDNSFASSLAEFYLDGLGVKADPVKAIELYETVSDYDLEAAFKLAEALESGTFIDRDLERALSLYSRVADADWWFKAFSNDFNLQVRAQSSSRRLQTALDAASSGSNAIYLGNFHALLIGNSDYEELPDLESAAEDVNLLASTLLEDFQFEVTVLENPSRGDIFEKLLEFRKKLGVSDNFLLYYAGHGVIDEELGVGYWQTVTASSDNEAEWIPTEQITRQLRAFKSRNAMVIADSCFAATVFRSGQTFPSPNNSSPQQLRALAFQKTRTAMTSGGLEPVPDSINGSRNSVFAESLALALKQTRGPTAASDIFGKIQKKVIDITSAAGISQNPQYAPLFSSGHEGGDFIFPKRSVSNSQ